MLKEWGLQLPNEPVKLDARTLQPEMVFFGRNQKVPGQVSADWMKYVRSNHAIRAYDIKNWILVYFNKDSRRAQNFASVLRKVGPGMGIDIADPFEVMLREDKIEGYIRGIKSNTTDQTQVSACQGVYWPVKARRKYR